MVPGALVCNFVDLKSISSIHDIGDSEWNFPMETRYDLRENKNEVSFDID